MNYPPASCGVSKNFMIIFRIVVTPECFYRGEKPRGGLAPLRGSSPGFAWIPAHGSIFLTMTLSNVEWVKACGNDGLRKGNKFYAASCGELTRNG